MKNRFNPYLTRIALASATLFLGSAAQAVDYYWNTTTTGSWGTGANWSDNSASGGTTGVVPGAADSIFFNQSSVNGAEVITVDADRSITGITFRNTGTTAINGNASGTTARTITLGTGGITLNTGAGNVTFGQGNGVLTIATGATTQVWTNNATSLTAGPVTGSGQLTLTGANASGNSLGQFALDLSAYTGNIVLNNARLANSVAANGFGTTGTILVNSGAQLIVNTANTTNARAVTINGDGWFDNTVQRGAIRFLQNGDFSNTVTLGSASRVFADSGRAGTFSGRITGGFGLTIGNTAAGTNGSITFSGATANDYSGLTTVNAGTLFLNKTAGVNAIAGNVEVGTSGALQNSASNQIADTATVTVNTSATGVWNLNAQTETIGTLNVQGTNAANRGFVTGVAGKLTVNNLNFSSGTITLNSAGAGLDTTITANTVSNTGGTWTFGTGAGTQSLVIGSGGLTIGGGSTMAVAGGGLGTTFISLGGNVTSQANAATNTISGTGQLRLNANRTFDVADGAAASDLTVSAIVANGSGTSGIIKTGSGLMTLGAANTFTGSLTIREGTLVSTNSAAITNASSLILGDSTGLSTVDATFDITTASVNYANAINVVGTNQVNTIRDTSFTLGLSGLITLTNANLTLNQATTANMTVTGGVTGTGNLLISGSGTGGSLAISTAAVNNTGTITNNGTGASATNISSVIGANVTGVTQNSSTSTLTLSGANTYAGSTTISAGTLSAGNIVVSGGNSNLGNATSAVTLGSAGAQGILSYTGNSATYTRGFTIGGAGGGRLNVTTAAQTLTVDAGGVTGSGLFTVGGAGNTNFSSVLSHTGGLTKLDAGTLLLSGANTYNGSTTLTAGTTQIGVGNVGSVGSITSGAFGTGGLIFNGGSLSSNGGTDRTILNAVTFAANATLGNATNNGNLIFSGTADLGAAVRTITANSNTQFDGIISGAGGITLGTSAGYGKLTLSNNANDFTGNLALAANSGTLRITSSGALGVGPKTFTNAGASSLVPTTGANLLELDSNGGADISLASNISFVTSGAAGVVLNTAGNNTINGGFSFTSGNGNSKIISNGGSLNLAGDISIISSAGGNRTLDLDGTSSGANTASGAISNGGGFTMSVTKNGTGTWALSGSTANTFTGLTTVSNGILQLGKSGAVNAIAGGGLTIGSANNTAATVRYTGTSTDMMGSGAVTINGRGILDFNGATDTIGNVTIASTGATGSNTTSIINTAGGGNLTIGSLAITPVADLTSVVNSGSGILTLGGNVTMTAATTGRSQVSGNLDLGSTSRTFTVGQGTGADYDMLVDAAITSSAGSFGLTKAGTGRLTLSNANSYSGATAVTAGILAIGHKDALNGTSSITVGTAISSTTSLRIDVADATSTLTGAGKSVTIRGLGFGNNGALLGADSASVTWAGGVVIGDTTGARIGGGTNGTLTVDGVISETTAGSNVLFSRAANSTTVLNKVNTYTGDTQLFMGGSTVTLKMGIANAISSSSRVLVSTTTTGTGFFDLNGFNQNVRAIADTVTGDLVVTNTSATNDAVLTLSTTDAQTFGGWVQDGATRKTSLVISGTGSQSFTNINTYTGGTRIDSGTLTLSHASNTLADAGAINVNGGTLALGANSDTVGAVTLSSGSITSTTGTLTGSSYDVRSGSISARLAGASVALTKSTGGTVTLTGTNTYTGATNVDAGKLVISSTGSTAAGSSVTVSNAGSEIVVDGTLGGALTINSGAILSGSGTITGSTTIAGIHNAGNSPGIQTFAGDLGYQAGSTVNWELGGNTTTQALPAIFDQIVVGGNLSFAATTTVNLLFNTVGSTVTWGDALWDSNQSWTLFDVAGTTTGLENVNLTTSNWADSTGALFDTVRSDGFFSLSLSGQDVMLNYTAVPETSVSLLGGLSALLLLRRKRR